MLYVFLLYLSVAYACIESRYPVYVCTYMGTDYYSPCMSDIASNWVLVDNRCPIKSVYYTAECTDNVASLTNITAQVKIGYHRAWWAHRIRPMRTIPKTAGAYQSINHSLGVKQDLLCIRDKYIRPSVY
jgi:hypothetical protein